MLLLEILALLLLSSFITSPLTYGYLFAAYILSKIARSWLRGCLPNSGGGALGAILGGTSSDDDDDFDGSDHPDEYEARRRRAASNSQVGPIIKLIPLGEEASKVVERVMTDGGDENEESGDNPHNQTTASVEVEEQQQVSGSDKMDMNMQPPKLKKEHEKKRQNANNNNNSEEEESKSHAKQDGGRPKEDDDEAMESMDVDGPDDQPNDNENNNGADDEDSPNNNNEEKNAIEQMVEDSLTSYSLDCYPYTFSPLLLFSNSSYFDRGYSNYNAVAAFFAPALRGLGGGGSGGSGARGSGEDGARGRRRASRGTKNGNGEEATNNNNANEEMAGDDEEEEYADSINMLHGVIYDRKNLTYDDLFTHIATTQSLVTCCIDAHFTAFQMVNKSTLIYYDPVSPSLMVAKGERDVHNAALYLLMKCHYGDNAHVQENKKHYTGQTSTKLQNAV